MWSPPWFDISHYGVSVGHSFQRKFTSTIGWVCFSCCCLSSNAYQNKIVVNLVKSHCLCVFLWLFYAKADFKTQYTFYQFVNMLNFVYSSTAIIDLIVFVSVGSSNFLSGIVLSSLGFLYTFIFIAVCYAVSMLLLIFQLKESLHSGNKAVRTMHWMKSPVNIYKLLKAPRSQKWRLRMLIPIDSLNTMVGQVVIGPILLLRLLNRPFCWNSKDIGFYRGSYYLVSGIGSVFAVKLLPKCFHKVFVILVSNISSFGYLIILGLFETNNWYYTGKYI